MAYSYYAGEDHAEDQAVLESVGKFRFSAHHLDGDDPLTLYLLSEIEKHFSSTSSEIKTLANVESVRHVLADAPDEANLISLPVTNLQRHPTEMRSKNLTTQCLLQITV